MVLLVWCLLDTPFTSPVTTLTMQVQSDGKRQFPGALPGSAAGRRGRPQIRGAHAVAEIVTGEHAPGGIAQMAPPLGRLYLTSDLRAMTGLARTHMDFYLREGIIQPCARTGSGMLL